MEKNNSYIRLKEYNNFEEKREYYQCNEVIEDKVTFDGRFAEWENQSADYMFRGVSEAKYMMYTSAQRKWIQEVMFSNFNGYSYYILHLIEKVRTSPVWKCFIKNGIPNNDFFILSLLQHYGAPSPLLDFSHNPRIALYFAFDNVIRNREEQEEHKEIDKYVSLYRIEYKCNDLVCNISDVEVCASSKADNLLEDAKKNNEPWLRNLHTSGVINAFKTQDYMEYKDVLPAFIIGGEHGRTDIKSTYLNFTHTYLYTNPRIIYQNASFILNTSGCRPLAEEIMHRYAVSQPKIIECININKNLATYVQTKYLKDINEDLIYPKEDCKLIQAIKEIV